MVVTEPEYIYRKGLGWIPITQSDSWWPWSGLTGEVPEDLEALIPTDPEKFRELLKIITPEPIYWDRDAIFKLIKTTQMCKSVTCVICPETFNEAYPVLIDKLSHQIPHYEALEYILNFWYSF